ncbi:MAG TPA: GNAT family N-acetyltransferase [Cytophagales bacterium]|nr:GNAT family N-acetyltransferase [Cytophagales bacterium]
MMEIKRITPTESHLVVALFNNYRIFYKQPADMELAKGFIQARLDKNESVIFVATTLEQGSVVPIGFVQLYPKFSSVRAIKIWILNDLFVQEGYRKQGVGERLINTSLKYAQEDGAFQVELSTACDNHTAQKLYDAMGFKRTKSDNDYFEYHMDLN